MQLQAETHPIPKKRPRLRYSNRTKCLLCYLICFSLPVLWQAAGLWLVYPYKLAGTAPNVAQNLANAFPFLAGALDGALSGAAIPVDATPGLLRAALSFRDDVWRLCVCLCFGFAWGLTLALQLLWRFAHARPLLASRATERAVHAYRVTQGVLWLLNGLFAATVWFLGARFISGRTAWDYLVYFAAYALNALAALCCFRLAAPPVLSGRHAFFKRL